MFKKDEKSIIIRIPDAHISPFLIEGAGPKLSLGHISGHAQLQHLLQLFDVVDPTLPVPAPARNDVVEDILSTLNTSPELFPFKNKGVLIGTLSCEKLERDRLRLIFDHPESEGILDGAHTMLALGLHILKGFAYIDDEEWRALSSWDDLTDEWEEHRNNIEQGRKTARMRVSVPVELIAPFPFDKKRHDKGSILTAFCDIAEARNNNVPVSTTDEGDVFGVFEALDVVLTKEIPALQVWWLDPEHSQRSHARELAALAWIPLSLLREKEALPEASEVPATMLYTSKGECERRLLRLLHEDSISQKPEGEEEEREITSVAMASAIRILADLPALYDQIYLHFPEAYNKLGRDFESHAIGRKYDPHPDRDAPPPRTFPLNKPPQTPFFGTKAKYKYPEGLILPLVYGLKGIMRVRNGEVEWAVDDPAAFLEEHMAELVNAYRLVLSMADWWAQKVAQDQNVYDYAVREFQHQLSEATLRKTRD